MVTDDLRKLINEGSELLTDYKTEYPPEDYLKQPASKTVNESIRHYHAIIDESYDGNGNMIKETDFGKLKDGMLLPFLEDILEQREDPSVYDRRLEPLGQQASNIRTQINMIEQESQWFANNIETQYNSLMVDKEGFKSSYTLIKEIRGFISDGLNVNK